MIRSKNNMQQQKQKQRQQQRKAVEIFDRGELNGKTIEVSMER